jgi:uroporphyrinogen III methyltransferase/synthase
MRDSLNWFESRPLFGQTIVVTRTRDQASALSDQLEALGANVLEAPTIETVAAPTTPVDAALRSLSRHAGTGLGRGSANHQDASRSADPLPDMPGEGTRMPLDTCVIFTSANGVRATRERMKAIGLDARLFAGVQIAVIGDATADAVRDTLAIEPDVIPKTFVAEGLADELIARDAVRGRRFVLLRADIARAVLVDKLRAAGAAGVEDIAVYETQAATALPPDIIEAVEAGRVDWVTFTSSSTARNFAALLGPGYAAKLANVKTASIGPVTSDALRALNLPVTVQAAAAGVADLVASVRSYSK